MVEFNEIELKWQKEWAKADLGTAKRDEGKEKFFLIFAYPGPSGYMHVGHMRGYSFSDAICRYKRMRGFNVFFPVGLHASGLPAVGVAKRVERGDEKWIKYLKDNGTSDADIKKMKDPNFVVEYFGKDYVERWKRFGFLADWGAFTSTNWPDYSKFIQWQFLQLREKKLLTQAPSFAPACVDCGPVAIDPSETDLRQGGTATQNEYTLLKFRFDLNGDEVFLIAATLRPETVYGQTNLWVNPGVDYVRAKVDGETWVVSEPCAEKLSYQGKDVEVEGKVPGKSLIGKFCVAPGVDREIPVLPAEFCDPAVGSGLVTCVPSDAPYDYIALKELRESNSLHADFGLSPDFVKGIELIPIIKTKGYSDFPAKDVVEEFGIKSQKDVELLEEATQKIYKAGFHTGVMMSVVGKYAGMQVSQAKDVVKQWLVDSGKASSMYDLSEEVICRCGGTVVVKLIPNQWFINYADDEWTSKSRAWARNMFVRPKDYSEALPDVMSWFKARPCARQGRWIGTEFPFEAGWIIEPIADSTLYPAYYVVSRYVNSGKLKPENLTPTFFDYVFKGKGSALKASESSGLTDALLKEIRAEFDYWYPLDLNVGGKEHRTVHFPPFVMNHTAILRPEHWPKGILVNGWVQMSKGAKISKSKGGATAVPDLINRFSVDAMRLYYAHAASLENDMEWDEEVAFRYRQSLEKFFSLIHDFNVPKVCLPKSFVSKALISRFQKKVLEAQEAFDVYDGRKYVQAAFFDVLNLVTDYLRVAPKGETACVFDEVFGDWLKILTPVIPHSCEELWHKLGNESLISNESWPAVDEDLVDLESEAAFDLVTQVGADVRNVLKFAKVESPKKVTLFVSEPWKFDLFTLVKSKLGETHNVGDVLKFVMGEGGMREYGKQVSKIVPSLIRDSSKLPETVLDAGKEFTALETAKSFLEKQFTTVFIVENAEGNSNPKAKSALPGKPAIFVE